jgi:hypothetical protein
MGDGLASARLFRFNFSSVSPTLRENARLVDSTAARMTLGKHR